MRIGILGPMHHEIEEKARAAGVDLNLYGNVDDDISVFVHASEAFGIFPAESILAGIPTVISDECGVGEFLTKDIPVVKTGDTDALRDRITDLMENPDIYKKGLR